MVAVDTLPTLPALHASGPEPPNGLFTIEGSACEIAAADSRTRSRVWFKSPVCAQLAVFKFAWLHAVILALDCFLHQEIRHYTVVF